jgi:hypothetical protein
MKAVSGPASKSKTGSGTASKLKAG